MKSLIIALCFVGAVVAGGNHSRIEDTPGCENAAAVKDTDVKTCCPDLPDLSDKETWTACKKECGVEKGHCCIVDCFLKKHNVLDPGGKFDAARGKEVLKTATTDKWPVDKIIDDCIAEAPATVKAWQEKMGGQTPPEKKCDHPENMAILRCTKRSVVTTCPKWVESESCTALMAFAKSCPRYPFGPKGGKKDGDKKDGDKKDDDDE